MIKLLHRFNAHLEMLRYSLSYPNLMLPPMSRSYDIRGIDEMQAYDEIQERLCAARMWMREAKLLPPIVRYKQVLP